MKALRLLTVFAAMLLLASTAFAQETKGGGTAAAAGGGGLGGKAAASLGVGLAIIGAGLGFGKIGSAALESMARQPEVAGQVRGAMIVIAALLEGATFFGLLICMLGVFFG
jgi:F-type H+-transporting ATPase subunit c